MLLTAWDTGTSDNKWPVLVIDEANKLMSWSDSHPQHLVTLLSFLVTLTKEKECCHVLMATSEYAYLSWLNNGKRGLE